MFLLPDWLFPSKADRAVASTGVEDADLLYAGSVKTDMRENVVEELDSRGVNVGELKPGDIEKEEGELYIDDVPAENLEGTKVFYRQKRFLSGLDDKDEAETRRDLQRLEEDYGLEFLNNPEGADIADDKELTKDLLDTAYTGIDGVEIPETYESNDEIDYLENDELLVRKEGDSSLGRGIDFIEAGDIDKFDDDAIYEEFLDHYEGEARDMRAFVVGGEPVAIKERVKETDKPEPKNLGNGGHYEDPDSISINGARASKIASEALDMPVAAVDYAEMEDGSVKVYEVNSTAQTSINNEMETDLYGEIADYLEEEVSEEETVQNLEAEYLEPDSTGEKASAV